MWGEHLFLPLCVSVCERRPSGFRPRPPPDECVKKKTEAASFVRLYTRVNLERATVKSGERRGKRLSPRHIPAGAESTFPRTFTRSPFVFHD